MWNLLHNWRSLLLLTLWIIVFSKPAHGLNCYVCSSAQLELCSTLHTLKELPSELCPDGAMACFTKVEDGITIRGCLLSDQMGNGNTCEDKDPCISCKTDKCNAQIFPEDRLSCLHCQGENCVNQTNTIEVRYPCVHYTDNDQCYAIFSHDGRTANRGCMSDPAESGRDFCDKNDAQCMKCSKRACNSQPVKFEKNLSCIKCTPDKNKCNNVSEETKAVECSPTTIGYKDACYIYQKGNDAIRGCLYEASDTIFNKCIKSYSSNCFMCNETDCNRKPIVSDTFRFDSMPTESIEYESFDQNAKSIELLKKDAIKPLKCYRCDDCDFMDSTKRGEEPEKCDILSEYDKCFTYIDHDKKMYRGCLSDSSEARLMCDLNGKHQNGTCRRCSGSGCNDQPKFGRPELSCVKCNNDRECAFGQDAAKAQQCTEDVMFGEEETCFVHAISDTVQVERGCTRDVKSAKNPDWCKEEKGCETCSTNACNVNNARYMWCVRCQDYMGDECSKLPNMLEFIDQCDYKTHPYSKRGCYTKYKKNNVTRGCIIDLSDQEYENCRLLDACIICTDNYCNNQEFSSSGKSVANSLLCSILILLLYSAQMNQFQLTN